MKTIPLSAVASQTVNVLLGGQNCTIKVFQKSTGLFVDVSVNNVPVVQGVIALNRNLIVRYPYRGFIGDLAFIDTQGAEDPIYTGFGGRFVFMYLEASDL
ncbi:phage baseplate plug protein [Herbaspirillum chlorophenolicum]|uniref:Phage baseplate plug protein n=1 Tax=Herbaspirillum chlorophenolicum TaxID=211589 RepID=A0ABW8F5E3_9BURK